MNAPTLGTVYPVLPLRDIVVFPGMIVPLFVGREKSVKALEEVMKDDKQILLIAQKNASQDDPGPEDIYTIGTLGTVLQLLKLPDDTVKVLVEGGRRVKIVALSASAICGRTPMPTTTRSAGSRSPLFSVTLRSSMDATVAPRSRATPASPSSSRPMPSTWSRRRPTPPSCRPRRGQWSRSSRTM